MRVFVNSSTEGFANAFVRAARAGTPVLSLEVNPDGILQGSDFGACADGDPGTARQAPRPLPGRQADVGAAVGPRLPALPAGADIEAQVPAFAHSLLSLRS